jgi:hypothetical protein
MITPESPEAEERTTRAARAVMRAGAGAGVAAAVLWLVMSLTYPFGWDQGIFAWAGGVILQGGMPYREAWDLKGPLAYYTYALAEWIFGVHLWSIRLLDAALLLAATLAVHRAAAALTSRVIGRWTALLFVLWYASHSYWHTAQPDGWTGMLLAIALGPLLARPDRTGLLRLAVAGVIIGAVALFKPIYAAFVLLPLAQIVVTAPPAGRIVGLAVLGTGWLVPLALTAGWFHLRGALDDLIEVHIVYAATYAGLSPGSRIRGLADYFFTTRVIAVALPLCIYGGVVLWRAGRRHVAVVLGAWSLVVIAAVLLQNRFFAYHWLPILPAAALLGAAGLNAVLQRAPWLAYVWTAVIGMHALAPVALEEMRFLAWATGRIDRTAYYEAYGEASDDMKAVWWLRDHGAAGSVYVFGWNTGVAWLSDRPFVSRFGFSMPLLIGEDAVRARYQHELIEALSSNPPRYLVAGTQSDQILGRSMSLLDFPQLAVVIQSNYDEATRIGKLTIYERRR